MDITEIYKAFYKTMKEYTFISASRGTFSQTDYILGHKASLNTYGKTELTPCIFSDHEVVKLYRKNNRYGRSIQTHRN